MLDHYQRFLPAPLPAACTCCLYFTVTRFQLLPAQGISLILVGCFEHVLLASAAYKSALDWLPCHIVAVPSEYAVSTGHGREDTFIGVHHSQKLHDKYGGEKQLITFPGDHNSMRQDHFYRRVQRFFKAVLIDSPEGRPCSAFAHVEIADTR